MGQIGCMNLLLKIGCEDVAEFIYLIRMTVGDVFFFFKEN